LKNLTRNLFVAASLLLSGGISTMANAQSQTPATSEMAPAQQQSRAHQLYGDIAPKMAELTDNVLYGDIWERPGLSKRDRSLVTIAALIALNRPDQLRSHINLGHQNGLTKDEIVETITHMAFYSGWPSAVSSLAIAKEVFQK
jgi:4-carboxymuconolactone decarboxylase